MFSEPPAAVGRGGREVDVCCSADHRVRQDGSRLHGPLPGRPDYAAQGRYVHQSHTVKAGLAVTFILSSQTVLTVLIFISAKQPPALSSHFLCFALEAA